MNTYTVAWTIELQADSPAEAARLAQAWQRDPDSLATVYTVSDTEHDLVLEVVDLRRVVSDSTAP